MRRGRKGFPKWSDITIDKSFDINDVEKLCKSLTALEKNGKETTKKVDGKEIVVPKENGIKFKCSVDDINIILKKGLSCSKDYKKVNVKIANAVRILGKTAASHGKKKNSFNCKTPKFKNTVNECVDAVSIFVHAFEEFDKVEDEAKKNALKNIESELFSMCFSIEEKWKEELGFEKTIYPVYFQHDEFIYTNTQTLLLESSTGSGKTRCAPFFYAIRIILENNDKRFAIISQNNKNEAKNKAKDFENFVGDNVKIVTDRRDFIQLYTNKYKEKPVVAMFTPFDILFIKEQLIKSKSNLFERTRICIDEVHQRSVLVDVLIGSISEAQTSFKFGCQFLMMSATPDESIMRSFKEKQNIQCKEKTLYSITEIKETYENDSDVIMKSAEWITKVINAMIERKSIYDEDVNDSIISKFIDKKKIIDRGNILCFLPGNSMIIDVISCVQDILYDNSKIYCFPSNFIREGENVDIFYSRIDRVMKEVDDPSITYVLPIKVASYVSQESKNIAQFPLRDKYSNIIKVICATNAVESSITIANLAAVVDSGLYNSPSFDIDRGITSLKIMPITQKMQTQRKGRIGRTRPGVSIQFTYKNMKMQSNIAPAILTSDLCSTILELRQIGIRLEDLKGLPDVPPKKDINKNIKELENNGLLHDGILTRKGKMASLFLGIPSSFVASIIDISSKKFAEKEEREIAMCYGQFITSVVFSSNIISNQDSPMLQKTFCDHSDFITIINAMIDLIKNHGVKEAQKIFEYGFNKKEFDSVICNTQTAFHNIIKENNEKGFNKKTWG